MKTGTPKKAIKKSSAKGTTKKVTKQERDNLKKLGNGNSDKVVTSIKKAEKTIQVAPVEEIPSEEIKITDENIESRIHKEPGFFKHIYEKSKRTSEESLEVESAIISFLIAWTSFCPSISMMEASKRLCKDDLVDELMVIDAIADNPRRRALRLYFKTVFKAISRNVGGYFTPLFSTNKKPTK